MGRGWIAAELITRQSLGRYHRATHGHASWMGTQGGQKERTKGKFRKNIYKKKNQKKRDDRFAGNPCGQLTAILEGKMGHVRPGMHAGTLLLIPFREGSKP